jgi:hypothetical protein
MSSPFYTGPPSALTSRRLHWFLTRVRFEAIHQCSFFSGHGVWRTSGPTWSAHFCRVAIAANTEVLQRRVGGGLVSPHSNAAFAAGDIRSPGGALEVQQCLCQAVGRHGTAAVGAGPFVALEREVWRSSKSRWGAVDWTAWNRTRVKSQRFRCEIGGKGRSPSPPLPSRDISSEGFLWRTAT